MTTLQKELLIAVAVAVLGVFLTRYLRGRI